MRWHEVERTFSFTRERRMLTRRLRNVLDMLKAHGCRRAYLDGSFTTLCRTVDDFDLVWHPEGVDVDRLDPILHDPYGCRDAIKQRYGGDVLALEVFPDEQDDVEHVTILDVFQWKQASSDRKGIVQMRLEDL